MLEIKIPSPGESITEVTISNWLKSDGDYVDKDDELFEIESDKATLSVSAEAGGVLKILIPEGENVEVGAVAATIDTAAKAESVVTVKQEGAPVITDPTKPMKTAAPVEAEPQPSHAAGAPSPVARKLMEEKGIAADTIKGSGPGGRITKADVLAYTPESAPQQAAPAEQTAPIATTPAPQAEKLVPAAPPKIEISGSRNERREKMSKLRLKVSERLVAVKNQTAMLTTFNEVDMSEIIALRKTYKDEFEKQHGVRLGFMSLFTKAVTEALKHYPAINAFIDGDEVVYHDYVDISIAVQAPRGLVVPVIRNAESLSLDQIEKEVARLADRARNNQLTIDEMTGGTFTISNGGVFGSLLSTPILNPPQSGILGMHKTEERPIALNGQVVIRPMMYLAFSYDHRIIDGRESVGFLVKVKENLENPVRMLLQV
ncbi:2-oxoglutarate dehydrogenase complex dihydrolipoyllysine-residue succinyltransferase [bacterium]|nr:2-oxoglutarate dehydrogenase complex dihydrolipoyllysine-residue succinyltransferase [bacterium]